MRRADPCSSKSASLAPCSPCAGRAHPRRSSQPLRQSRSPTRPPRPRPSMPRAADESGAPLGLLHRSESVEGYPFEPSDEGLAEALGLPVSAIVRFDMNTLGGGPLPGVVEAHRAFDPQRALDYGDEAYRRLRHAIGAYVGVAPSRVIVGAGADEL